MSDMYSRGSINRWLLVQHRITYKLAVLTNIVRTTSTPVYLSHHIRLRDSVRILRSTMTTRLSEPFASTAFAKCAFHCSAPATWNSLPRTVTYNDSLGTFKSRLKTFLFSLAFNWHWHYPPPAPLKLRPNGPIQIYYYYYYNCSITASNYWTICYHCC